MSKNTCCNRCHPIYLLNLKRYGCHIRPSIECICAIRWLIGSFYRASCRHRVLTACALKIEDYLLNCKFGCILFDQRWFHLVTLYQSKARNDSEHRARRICQKNTRPTFCFVFLALVQAWWHWPITLITMNVYIVAHVCNAWTV